MKPILKTTASALLAGAVLILPFVALEVINRRQYQEEFPFSLFYVMWLNLFAIAVVLLPFGQVFRPGGRSAPGPAPSQRTHLLARPTPAALISLGLLLSLGILPLLDTLGWLPLERLINGPVPEQVYLPGLLIPLALFLVALAAAVIACGPVVRTVQTGGSLFAHPVNLMIVTLYVAVLAYGVGSLIIDQWPCFMGVPLCD